MKPAQAHNGKPYIGRFAPSPTGHLHFGSLITALASFLQARTYNGLWLLRMEDIDPPRVVPGSSDLILKTLRDHGLTWDGDLMYQSTRQERHREILQHLLDMKRLFPCTCSRRTLAGATTYPGTCRDRPFPENQPHALRIRCEGHIAFEDGLQGKQWSHLEQDGGDFIVLRRDDCIAYQLACVVDDHDQGVTEVVRGADLLESTPRQIFLFQALQWLTPQYVHLPLALDPCGEKLGKSTGAPGMHNNTPNHNLYSALVFLRQSPPRELQHESVEKILEWAISNWKLNILASDSGRVPDSELD